ncbi:nuclear apoptosis-inducing factor 1-like isoform X3 [Mercenaria mercenaria]|uniref:nuclear apoptosis-inducing factor 1-like isoform X3 n=1 Tax=Mercenaria mercenaria TaxID=6596 RepID=UPI00234E5992|nr:nuclear apoptosis-inducing factor 1-like isoform X3 [Mercenaria mercenaria]XP_053390175.1 nuclear apoptosis-inducing factor 1-like isoform X3 [Mercenaria mercenaria]
MSDDKVTKKSKWSEGEVILLVEEVTGNEKLGRKFSPDNTAVDRTRFWSETTKKINAVGGKERNVKQVEKKWRDLKSQTKSREVKRRTEAKKTGGGVSEAPCLSSLEEKILGTLPSCSLDGIPGGKDSSLDSSMHDDSNSETNLNEILQTRSDSSRQPDLAFSKSTAVTGKSLQKRAISGTEEFIYKMEEKKVAELQLINKTLSSIDSSLKELVAIKKKKLETEIESNFLHQFEF